jgi:hypothetical protein
MNAGKEVGLEINIEKTKYMKLNLWHTNSKQILWKCVIVQIFGDDDKSEFESGGK